MDSERQQDAQEAAIAALAQTNGDALAKAHADGFPDPHEVVEWAERVKHLVLHQRDRSRLRAEVPALGERLERLLRAVTLPPGADAAGVVARFLAALPRVRSLLAEDVEAAFEGDPAAKSYAEIVVAYPSIEAIAMYRLAHELYAMGVPAIPRIMTEHAHSRTGVDINPGAKIGRRFFIDHGTGVVIGETAVVGDRVTLYQGVTLGAKSFQVDKATGALVKGVPRHPVVEDDVTIYASATVLGRITVGRGSVIGGNVWLTHSVPPNSRVSQAAPQQGGFTDGAGI